MRPNGTKDEERLAAVRRTAASWSQGFYEPCQNNSYNQEGGSATTSRNTAPCPPPVRESLRPTSLSKEDDDRLGIQWNDGHRVPSMRGKHLREACPCAGCLEEQRKPPDPSSHPQVQRARRLRPVSITPVGHYAYRITWSDGHDTGLYTLEYLAIPVPVLQVPSLRKREKCSSLPADLLLVKISARRQTRPGRRQRGKEASAKSTGSHQPRPRLHTGLATGLLDADIYGPSIPIMMGVHEVFDPNTTAWPLDRYGLKPGVDGLRPSPRPP